MRLSDTDLEKLDAHLGYFVRLLPDREIPGDVETTDDMLRLRAFRLRKLEEENASLEDEDGVAIDPITDFAAT